MKYVKVLGLAAVVAAALMAFAGSASATILTSPSGTQLGVGAEVKAELKEGEAVLKSNFIGETKCKKSTTAGKVTNAGSATTTVVGSIESLTFTECNAIVTVLKTGTLEVHTEGETANGNGTVTSSGAEVTVEIAGFHCIFATSNTDIGQITGGTPAVLTAHESAIPRVGGRSGALCGSSASWNAVYKVTSPGTLLVD